jgi:hypothetical protein
MRIEGDETELGSCMLVGFNISDVERSGRIVNLCKFSIFLQHDIGMKESKNVYRYFYFSSTSKRTHFYVTYLKQKSS